MKWLEIIRVQAAIGLESRAEDELTGLVRDVRNRPDNSGLLEIRPYHHASIPGCFVIQLTWNTKTPWVQGSLLGLRLTQTLKSFGLADHSVWISKE